MIGKLLIGLVLWMAQAQPPSLPFVEPNICPFEGCTYGKWTATKSTAMFDTWRNGRKTIAKINAGNKVTALNGVVITLRPGVVRMDRDMPELKLKKGDQILTYSYRGEGLFNVWVNGHFEREYDLTFMKWPDSAADAFVIAQPALSMKGNINGGPECDCLRGISVG